MLDFSWNNILQSNAFNFAIMIAFFAFIAHKIKVSQAVEKHRASIQKTIEDSDILKSSSEKELENVEKSLEKLPEELDEILKNAQKTANAFEEKSKAEINKLVKAIKQNAEKQLYSEEKHTNSMLLKSAGNASVEVAGRQVSKALENNKELHRKFIQDFINEIDRLEV